jgi:hypothetical protein
VGQVSQFQLQHGLGRTSGVGSTHMGAHHSPPTPVLQLQHPQPPSWLSPPSGAAQAGRAVAATQARGSTGLGPSSLVPLAAGMIPTPSHMAGGGGGLHSLPGGGGVGPSPASSGAALAGGGPRGRGSSGGPPGRGRGLQPPAGPGAQGPPRAPSSPSLPTLSGSAEQRGGAGGGGPASRTPPTLAPSGLPAGTVFATTIKVR